MYNNLKSHSSSSWIFLLCLQIDSKSDTEGATMSLKCCLWNFLEDRKEAGRQCWFDPLICPVAVKPFPVLRVNWFPNTHPSNHWSENSSGVDSKGREGGSAVKPLLTSLHPFPMTKPCLQSQDGMNAVILQKAKWSRTYQVKQSRKFSCPEFKLLYSHLKHLENQNIIRYKGYVVYASRMYWAHAWPIFFCDSNKSSHLIL